MHAVSVRYLLCTEMVGGKSALIFFIFYCIMVSARAPSCKGGGRCADLLDWEEDRRRTTTAAPRTYSPAEFLSVSDGSISCRAVSDCPTLSKEELLFKMQLAGSYASSADECSIDCENK